MKNAEVDTYLKNAGPWKKALTELRRIALDAGLEEAFKWRQPCYEAAGTNVAILQGFKNRCALMFFQGALLKDPKGLLEPPGRNSQVARRMVFTGVDEVLANEKALRRFLAEARKLAVSGAKVETKPDPDPLPDEMRDLFREVKGLQRAFEALTPGRRRGYVLHVSGAKQAKTRRARIERCVPRILAGKGLDDR